MATLRQVTQKTIAKVKSIVVETEKIPDHVLVLDEVFLACKHALNFIYTIRMNLQMSNNNSRTGDSYHDQLAKIHQLLVEIFKTLKARENYYSSSMKMFMTLLLESVSSSTTTVSYLESLSSKNYALEFLQNFLLTLLPYRETKKDVTLGDFYQYIHPYLMSDGFERMKLLISAFSIPPCCKSWDIVEIPIKRNGTDALRKKNLLLYIYYLLTRNIMLENRLSLSPMLSVNFHTTMPENKVDVDSITVFKAKMVVPNLSEVLWSLPNRERYKEPKLNIQNVYLQAAIRDSLRILDEASIAYRNFAPEHFLMYPNEVLHSQYKHILLTDFRRATFYGSIPESNDTYDQLYHFGDELYTTVSNVTNVEDCLIWLSNIQTSIKLDLSSITDPKYVPTVITVLRDSVQDLVVNTTQMESKNSYYKIIQMLIDYLPKDAVLITTIKLRSLETSPITKARESLGNSSPTKSPINKRNHISTFLKLSKQSSTSSGLSVTN